MSRLTPAAAGAARSEFQTHVLLTVSSRATPASPSRRWTHVARSCCLRADGWLRANCRRDSADQSGSFALVESCRQCRLRRATPPTRATRRLCRTARALNRHTGPSRRHASVRDGSDSGIPLGCDGPVLLGHAPTSTAAWLPL